MTIEKIRPRCFLDIEIDGQNTGRIIIELFADICPLTCDNFRALCTGEKGLGKTTDKPLHYKGVPFHRIVKNFIIQSGDFISGNGTGGESIYGGTFKDENFEIKHDKPFLLSMANKGKDTNGSQFFITTQPAPHLDGKHTVFGHVISGQQVVMEIENQKTTNSRPLKEVVIANCGELVLKMKQKAKKVRSESESSSSSPENERSRSKRKKRNSRKLEKKSKKEKKEKPCPRVDSAVKYEESFDCSVDPDEIPEVPANNFLMRRSPIRDENQKSSGRQSGFVFARKPALSRSGRKIKGRGLMRYRTPSPSGSRSGSETPPHWRQAQARVVPLDEVIKKVSKLDRSRSATPSAQDDFEQEAPQKADGIPLRQRLGRRINDVRTDEDEYGLRGVSSNAQRSRNERQTWEIPRGRNDHSSSYRRERHSVIEEDSDTSTESKSRHHSFRSMVVKADSEKHVHNDERDRRSRRSPPVRKERQRSPDHWQNRSDDLPDIRTSRNQNLEKNCRKGRFQKEVTNKSSTAKLKHESVKEDRRSRRESNSRRSPRKIEHTSSKKSPSSKHKHSLSSDSDVDKRRKRKKETIISERGSSRYHLDSHNSQQYSDNKTSQNISKNAGESPESQNDYKAVPKYEEPDVKNKIRKSSESETSINNSLKKTLAAYARDASVSSESENDNNEGNTAAANNKIIFANSNELVTSSEEKYIEKENSCTENSVTHIDEMKSEMPENYSSTKSLDVGITQTSSSIIENDNSVTQCEKVLTDPVTINETKKNDAQSSRDDFVENQSDCKESQSKFPGSKTKTEVLESSDIQNLDHESSDKISAKPMEIDPISVRDELAAVPESTSPPIEENEPIVTSSVEDDKLIAGEAGNLLEEEAKEVDYTCIPLDVIPLPEETAPFVFSRTDTEQIREKSRGIFAPSLVAREPTVMKVGSSGCVGKRDVISPKNIESRSRSSSLSSSAEIVPLAVEESPVGKDFHKNEEELSHIKEKKASSIRARALKAFSDEEKEVMRQQGDTSIIMSLSHSDKNSQKSSGFKDRSKQGEKSGTNADEYIDYKFRGTEFSGVGESSPKADEKTSIRSSSHSSAERMLKNVTSKSQSVEQKPSTSRYRRPSDSSPTHLHKSPRRHTSYSPRSDRRSHSIDLKSRSPVRSRRSPASRRRRSPSPSPSRRDYQKSRSPITKSKSPRRRSRSSSRSISGRRSRSRSRSPVHRRYSRSPDRRYHRRSWSRSYDGRSRFSRYPRLRNKSPNRQYSRPYGRDNERMRLNRRSSRSRSRSRSEMDHRRKRRQNRSSSSASSSRSSSSSSGDKKLSKKRSGKKKQRSSSSSSSSRSSSN